MKGIQYIVDDNGEKTAVVIDLKQWSNVWEEIYNILSKNAPSNEEWLNQFLTEKKLNEALEWNANNPPQISDLDELEKQINSHE
jgi:hypothetical protein